MVACTFPRVCNCLSCEIYKDLTVHRQSLELTDEDRNAVR